jgi:RNA polymerase sigma factor (sigma-70 family)
MDPFELFRANLSLVDRVITGVCRRAGLRDADAEDFASTAKLALMENDYAILRTYEGRSSLGTFLTIVVQRLLSRERARMWGRWHSSAEAERLGPAAVLLEKLLVRDGRSIDEAMPLVRALDPSLDRTAVQELAARLPSRAPRARLVPLPDTEDQFEAAERTDQRVREADARETSERAARVVRETLAVLPLEDRMLMRFRFGAELSIADTARLLGVPQRPLYRRIEVLLRQLREALEREGVDAALVADVISAAGSEGMDFGLNGKSEAVRRSKQEEERR